LQYTKDQIIIYLISLIGPIAFNFTIIALPLKAINVGLTRGTVSLVIFVSNMFQVIGRPISGYVGDRVGSKKPLFLANALYVISYSLFYIAKNLFIFLLASAIQGLAASFMWNSIFSHVVRAKWSEPSVAISSVLSIAFFGGVVGLSLSGFLVEIIGVDKVFLASSILIIINLVSIITIKNVGGGEKPSLKTVFTITMRNVKETYLNVNSIAIFPLIRTYGTLLLLDAGLSEGFIGILFTIYRILSVIMQYPAAKMYNFLVEKRTLVNIASLTLFITFTYLVARKEILLGVAMFVIASMLNNLLPSSQLTKATTDNMKYSSLGAGGFGAGLSIVRLTNTGIATIAGSITEQHYPELNAPEIAIYTPLIILTTLSTIQYIKTRKRKQS